MEIIKTKWKSRKLEKIEKLEIMGKYKKIEKYVYTVTQNEYYTPRLRVFCLVHLRHLPKEKMTQVVYHFKALI